VAVAGAQGPPLAEAQREVLGAVESGAATLDAVAAASDIGFAEVQAALGALERAGYLRADPGGRYARSALLIPPAAEAPGRADPASTIDG
jgi:predicted Rossmann fold nucleotide-binding protein DprA/Smf involved in DNA uptake